MRPEVVVGQTQIDRLARQHLQRRRDCIGVINLRRRDAADVLGDLGRIPARLGEELRPHLVQDAPGQALAEVGRQDPRERATRAWPGR